MTDHVEPGARPLLSVVVVIVSDTTASRCDASHLAGCLEALHAQVAPPPLEVIVPHHLQVEGLDELRRRYPEVRFIPVPDLRTFSGLGRGTREHHDELRARGIQAARGEVVALLEDHAGPDPNWCRQVMAAHGRGYAAVGGAIENGVDRALNWAVYFCDFGKYQNPLPAGPAGYASDANVSYKREALEAVRGTWTEIFQEPRVNGALLARGEQIALSPEIVVLQQRHGLKLRSALAERFVWGRSYAASRGASLGSRRLLFAALSPLLPGILLLRMGRNVAARGRTSGSFAKALPYTAMLLVAWSCGELVGYLRGGSAAAPRQVVTAGAI
jgi:hypothetical protein